MSSFASRFYSRAPRFILQSDENMTLRFAPLHSRREAFETDLLDVSESGLAFQIQLGDRAILTLEEGSVLKIEFIVPGGAQIACFATLTRIEPLTTWDPEFGLRHAIKAAVQFRNLPKRHLATLQKSFAGNKQADLTLQPRTSLSSLCALGTGFAALVAFFYLMALPPNLWLNFLK